VSARGEERLPPARAPLSRAKARNAALINQLATPGLGSLLAGRWLVGLGQLLLAVAGFSLVIAWFVLLFVQFCRQMEGAPEPTSVAWLGELGAATFVLAWVWALFTSLSLLRAARAREPGPGSNPAP